MQKTINLKSKTNSRPADQVPVVPKDILAIIESSGEDFAMIHVARSEDGSFDTEEES